MRGDDALKAEARSSGMMRAVSTMNAPVRGLNSAWATVEGCGCITLGLKQLGALSSDVVCEN